MLWLFLWLSSVMACTLPSSAVSLARLRPLQVGVGLMEVQSKAADVQSKSPKALTKYLQKRPMQIVFGPRCELWLVDGHHLARALLLAGVLEAPFQLLGDLSSLSDPEFEKEMRSRNWVWLFDEQDRPVTFQDLPVQLEDMKDDPYRSLAWKMKKEGVYRDLSEPFQQFHWARFYRRFITLELLTHFPKLADDVARVVSRSSNAAQLPGFLTFQSCYGLR